MIKLTILVVYWDVKTGFDIFYTYLTCDNALYINITSCGELNVGEGHSLRYKNKEIAY